MYQLLRTYASLFIDVGACVTVITARLAHKQATEALQIYSDLGPSSEGQARLMPSRAFESAEFSRTNEEHAASALRRCANWAELGLTDV